MTDPMADLVVNIMADTITDINDNVGGSLPLLRCSIHGVVQASIPYTFPNPASTTGSSGNSTYTGGNSTYSPVFNPAVDTYMRRWMLQIWWFYMVSMTLTVAMVSIISMI